MSVKKDGVFTVKTTRKYGFFSLFRTSNVPQNRPFSITESRGQHRFGGFQK